MPNEARSFPSAPQIGQRASSRILPPIWHDSGRSTMLCWRQFSHLITCLIIPSPPLSRLAAEFPDSAVDPHPAAEAAFSKGLEAQPHAARRRVVAAKGPLAKGHGAETKKMEREMIAAKLLSPEAPLAKTPAINNFLEKEVIAGHGACLEGGFSVVFLFFFFREFLPVVVDLMNQAVKLGSGKVYVVAGDLGGAGDTSGAVVVFGPVNLFAEDYTPGGDHQALKAGAGKLVAVDQAPAFNRPPGGPGGAAADLAEAIMPEAKAGTKAPG